MHRESYATDDDRTVGATACMHEDRNSKSNEKCCPHCDMIARKLSSIVFLAGGEVQCGAGESLSALCAVSLRRLGPRWVGLRVGRWGARLVV